MKKIGLGQTITILVTICVIAGILFLAVEVRQKNEPMRDEAKRAPAESIRDARTQVAENGELAAIVVKELDGENLNVVEKYQLSSYFMRGLVAYQTSYQQLPREEVERMANYFRRTYQTSPTWRTTWEQKRDTFQPDFVQFIEQNVVNGR